MSLKTHLLTAAGLLVVTLACKQRAFNAGAQVRSNPSPAGTEAPVPVVPKTVTLETLNDGYIAKEVKDLIPTDPKEQKALMVFDSTSLTYCDNFYYADAIGKSWLEAKIDGGSKLLAGDKSWIDVLLNHAAKPGIDISDVKKDASGAVFSANAIAECTIYLKVMRLSQSVCGQHMIADYASQQIQVGKTEVLDEPFVRLGPKGLSNRSFKAQSGLFGQRGELKKFQDKLIEANAFFEKKTPPWQGYPSDDGKTFYCNTDAVKLEIEHTQNKIDGTVKTCTGKKGAAQVTVYRVIDGQRAWEVPADTRFLVMKEDTDGWMVEYESKGFNSMGGFAVKPADVECVGGKR